MPVSHRSSRILLSVTNLIITKIEEKKEERIYLVKKNVCIQSGNRTFNIVIQIDQGENYQMVDH